MKLTVEMIKNDLVSKEGYFEAYYKLSEVENLDKIIEAAEKENLEVWFDTNDNEIRFTLQDN